VDAKIMALMRFCRDIYAKTDGLVDAAMGSVLSLWHDARTNGIDFPEEAYLPDEEQLKTASGHMGFDRIVLDEAASTVFIPDPMMRLDVGALGKGFAVEQVCKALPEGLLLSVGGNIRATGPNPATGKSWTAGIQNPDNQWGDYLHVVHVDGISVVTSGDYQRYYTVDGVRYGHIIDPRTLYPTGIWRAVCILAPDSGVADALSTALFLLPLEEGQALLDQCGAEAMWVDAEGNFFYSPGFETHIRT
jgi:thiamine biosynthesis lipoprotein